MARSFSEVSGITRPDNDAELCAVQRIIENAGSADYRALRATLKIFKNDPNMKMEDALAVYHTQKVSK